MDGADRGVDRPARERERAPRAVNDPPANVNALDRAR
jgi:hypothetical protein